MFFDLHFVRYWNSLPKLRRSLLFILIWISITFLASYLYILSWSPNHGFEHDINIIPEILKPQNWFSRKDNADEWNLEKWIIKYPRVRPFTNGSSCTGQCTEKAFNTTNDSWSGYRVGRWENHHELQNKELLDPNQTCEYIFIGDSITFFWEWNQGVFDANFNTDNNGVIYAYPGDIISDIGWRLKHGDGFKNMKQCLLNHPLSQKSIVLLIGTNNMGMGQSYDVALQDYEHLLQQFAEFLEDINKQRSLVLNVMAIFPREGARYCKEHCDHWTESNPFFQNINFMNEYLESFIEHQDNDNMRFIDCNRAMLQRVGSTDWRDMNGESHQFITGDINTTIFPDGLHLSNFFMRPFYGSLGYERWTGCLKRQSK